MDKLTYLSFEITNVCPMAKLHFKCPTNAADRFDSSPIKEPITDDDIVNFSKYAISKGFKGLINWHYYNEPLTAKDRILDIIDRMEGTGAKFGLWTNGILLERDVEKCAYFNKFSEIVITDYYPAKNKEFYSALMAKYPQVRLNKADLDDRIFEIVETSFDPRYTKCGRPGFELIIDYYGNGHVCCGDWRNEIKFGNIKIDSYDSVESQWKSLKQQLSNWDENSYHELPNICKVCLTRTPILSRAGL